jgi:hypothetical protein
MCQHCKGLSTNLSKNTTITIIAITIVKVKAPVGVLIGVYNTLLTLIENDTTLQSSKLKA